MNIIFIGIQSGGPLQPPPPPPPPNSLPLLHGGATGTWFCNRLENKPCQGSSGCNSSPERGDSRVAIGKWSGTGTTGIQPTIAAYVQHVMCCRVHKLFKSLADHPPSAHTGCSCLLLNYIIQKLQNKVKRTKMSYFKLFWNDMLKIKPCTTHQLDPPL